MRYIWHLEIKSLVFYRQKLGGYRLPSIHSNNSVSEYWIICILNQKISMDVKNISAFTDELLIRTTCMIKINYFLANGKSSYISQPTQMPVYMHVWNNNITLLSDINKSDALTHTSRKICTSCYIKTCSEHCHTICFGYELLLLLLVSQPS